jgi:tol-pal system protein YbgF
MVVVVDGVKLQLQNVQEANAAKSDQVSGQIQSLNDSLDELKARLTRMEKSINDIQGQQQSTNALLNNLPATGAPATSSPAPVVAPPTAGPAPRDATPSRFAPITSDGPAPLVATSDAAGAAPVTEMYRSAYSDYMGAKYPLATAEFADLIKAYPDETLAGNAFFYLGEIDVRNGKLTNAVKDYDQVLERYPDNNKIPAAHLHKALALISMKQNDAGVRELRALIQRFPNSPEASQARTKLNSLHVATR